MTVKELKRYLDDVPDTAILALTTTRFCGII